MQTACQSSAPAPEPVAASPESPQDTSPAPESQSSSQIRSAASSSEPAVSSGEAQEPSDALSSEAADEDSDPNGGQKPQVTIEMDDGGKIVLELLPEYAPNTVNNFISLVKSGYYDGTVFHRIIPEFMIQGGDPEGTGMGGPDYSVAGEFSGNGFAQNTLTHSRGVLSMARSRHPDSAGSQFFICVADYPSLDGNYAAFGRVLSGIEVADDIVMGPTVGNNGQATEPRTMVKVTVDTFGAEYPEPVKISG